MLTDAPVVAVSLKMYFGHDRGSRWIASVARRASTHRGLAGGLARLVALPSFLQIPFALGSAPAGPALVAYEPVWAIGQSEAAPWQHIQIAEALRSAISPDPARAGSSIIYGGSAGPGILETASGALDGLFLGRSAHDVATLFEVVDEACALGVSGDAP